MRGSSWLALLLFTWGCGGETDSQGSGGSSSGGTSSGGTSSGGTSSGGTAGVGGSVATGGVAGNSTSGGTGGVSVGCPTAAPNPGGACSPGAAVCVYSCTDCFCPDGTWQCN